MESWKGHDRNGERGGARAALVALIVGALVLNATLAAGAADGARTAPASPSAFVRSDEAERLVLALESAQTEIEHAALARAEIADAQAARNPVRIAQAWLAAAASNTPLLAGAGVGGGVLIGMALVGGLRGAGARPRMRAAARRATSAAAPNASETPPRSDSVHITPAAARARESESENVWAKILRLSGSGMSGEEISRALGASADDINLVLGLQRRRLEIAGALAQSSAGRAKTAGS